ncbi:hypothetical protein BHM03_00037445 [Ensete ventricosum]|nr:hypothetical protein BHM03_00037445 [Ensete ventricosum]
MLQRANQYMATEALMARKWEDKKWPRTESSRGPPPGPLRRSMERPEPAIPRPPPIPLNSSRTEIFLQIWEKGLLRAPNLLKTRPVERDRRRYCLSHYDYDHDTEECYNLKNQIEDLIHQGHLSHYVRKLCKSSLHPKGPMEKQIDVIVSGPTSGDALVKLASTRALGGCPPKVARLHKPTIIVTEVATAEARHN